MSDSPERSQWHARVAAERDRQRRTLVRSERLLALFLLATSLFAWENHPRVVADPMHPGLFVAREVGHTAGLGTMPAGPLTIALALATLVWSSRLASGRATVGWTSLGRSLVILGVVVVELIQLLLGRRNWQERHAPIANPVLAHAVGLGVWLGLVAALGLLIVSLLYLWRVYGSWKDVLAPPADVRRA
ncbi:MAG TPA: hypothetical protein VLS91_03680 [Acidimicrobiales bacterium]|nr:hypothetical protein [Acidimicrobiales bacterium]